jgi:phosphoribosylamine-glycine ligase
VNMDDVLLFHAGTARRDTGELVATGGRVFSVTGVADTFDQAQQRSRAGAERIEFEGKHFRMDIGWREQKRRQGARAS